MQGILSCTFSGITDRLEPCVSKFAGPATRPGRSSKLVGTKTNGWPPLMASI